MDLKIIVSPKFVYGKDVYSPESPQALAAADLLGAKNLSKTQLEKLKAMGFRIEVITPKSGLEGIAE